MTQHKTSSSGRSRRLAGTVLVAALVLAACGDDDAAEPVATEPPATQPPATDPPATDPPVTDPPVTDPPVTEPPATEPPATDPPGDVAIEVVAVDYAFEGLPDTVEAGTVLSLTNQAPTELHELVAIRLPDDEERPVSELVTLPIEELGAILAVEPAAVLLALPDGGPMIPAVDDGTLSDAGRYAVICMIPQGADVDEFLEAAAASQGGPPQVDGGPPHIVFGMFAELRVV
jgi:hypothetical protein